MDIEALKPLLVHYNGKRLSCNAGDTISVTDDQASRLVNLGAARIVEKRKTKSTKSKDGDVVEVDDLRMTSDTVAVTSDE